MTWELPTPPLRLRTGSMLESTSDEQLREVPYVVRGRDPELRTLLGAVAHPPSVLRLILGPPRSGKTSLLCYLEKWAHQGEMHVVRIESQALNSDAELSATIDPEGAQHRSERTGGHFAASIGVMSGGVETSSETAAAVESNIRRAIEAATQRHAKGILLTIDEVETLIDKKDPAATRRLQQLIQFMHRAIVVPQTGGRLLSAVLVATGSLNAIEDLQQAEITGIESRQTVRLGPVGPRAAARIVEDHWEYGKPLSIDELPRPPPEWLAQALDECGGFVRHIQDLGLETAKQAARIAERGGREFKNADIEELESVLSRSRIGLYGNRWTSAGCNRHAPTAAVGILLAQASQAWDNRIPDQAVYDLTKVAMEGVNESQRETGRLQAVRNLQRTGIIEYRQCDLSFHSVRNAKVAKPHWTVPIPSLVTHILEELGKGRASDLDQSSPAVQRWLRPDAATKREHWVPPWEWEDME